MTQGVEVLHRLGLGLKGGVGEGRRVGGLTLRLTSRGLRDRTGGVHRLGLSVRGVVLAYARRRHAGVVRRPGVGGSVPVVTQGVEVLHRLGLGLKRSVGEGRRVSGLALLHASSRLRDRTGGVHRLGLSVRGVVLAHTSRRHRAVVRRPLVGGSVPVVADGRDRLCLGIGVGLAPESHRSGVGTKAFLFTDGERRIFAADGSLDRLTDALIIRRRKGRSRCRKSIPRPNGVSILPFLFRENCCIGRGTGHSGD